MLYINSSLLKPCHLQTLESRYTVVYLEAVPCLVMFRPETVTKLYGWHYAFGQVVGCWHLPDPDSFINLADGLNALKHFMHFHRYKVHWWQALHQPSQYMPLHTVTLGYLSACSCTFTETHFIKFTTNYRCAQFVSIDTK